MDIHDAKVALNNVLSPNENCQDLLQKKVEDAEHETEGAEGTKNTPDGGWGWLCVAAAFVVNIITDGCSYSFGILFVDLIEYFGESRSKTAWIGSLFAAVPLLCGPLASLVTNKLGYRKSTILGGFITLSGFVLSNFVTSIEQLYLTYGVVAGLGISLPYLTSIVVVADYFEKKRALATGMAECGAGVGTLIFAPILERLIEEYDWRGAILILGGIASNIIVCGAIFRPLDSFQNIIDDEPLLNKDRNDSITKHSEIQLENKDCENLSTCDSNVASIGKLDRRYSNTSNSSVISGQSIPRTFSGTSRQVMRAARSLPNLDKQIVKKENEKLANQSSSFISKISKWINLRVMCNPVLIAFTITNFILYFWYDVPYVFTVDRATSIGISSRQASYIVACIGISHLSGNLMFGFLGDRPELDRSIVYCVGLMFCGFSLILVPFTKHYTTIMVLAGIFGLLSAAAEALGSVIIADIVGVDNLTDAFGIVMFLQGIANLFGPPFAGRLFDLTGSYDATFWSAGACVGAATSMYLLIPLKKRCQK